MTVEHDSFARRHLRDEISPAIFARFSQMVLPVYILAAVSTTVALLLLGLVVAVVTSEGSNTPLSVTLLLIFAGEIFAAAAIHLFRYGRAMANAVSVRTTSSVGAVIRRQSAFWQFAALGMTVQMGITVLIAIASIAGG
jgi:hypothetical protein